MKNTIFRIITLTLTLVLLISALASCEDKNADGGKVDNGKPSGGHKHSFVWYQDNEQHLKEYTCGCEYDKTFARHDDSDEDGYCDFCNYNMNTIAELSDMIKTAYVNSFEEKFEADFDKIYIRNYYGMIGDAHIVSIYSDYIPERSGKGFPDGAYIQRVERMEFRYDKKSPVYIIHNEKLYSAKSAYENKIIDFNGLCKLFGLHTSKDHTFSEKIYSELKSSMKLAEPEWAEYYELKRYYGEYNGYHAVSYNFLGMQVDAAFDEQINNLNFSYAYRTCRIRLMNDTEMYTLGEAKEKGILTDEDIFELFAAHGGGRLNEELVNELLTPVYEFTLKYSNGPEDINGGEITFDSFWIKCYYGEYHGCHVFRMDSEIFMFDLTDASEDEAAIVKHGGFWAQAYILHEGKLYTLDQALEKRLVGQKVKDLVN